MMLGTHDGPLGPRKFDSKGSEACGQKFFMVKSLYEAAKMKQLSLTQYLCSKRVPIVLHLVFGKYYTA